MAVKYYTTVDGQTYEISIESDGRITVDGKELNADMQRLGQSGLRSLLLNRTSHEVMVEPAGPGGDYEVLIGGARYEVQVQDVRSRRRAPAGATRSKTPAEAAIRPPIPGLVVKVLVEPGQSVAEGQPLLILEAMKMENELRAPRAGVVHEVRVKPGAQVSPGQVLLTLQ